MLNSIIRFFLENRLIAFLLLIVLIVGGLMTVPFSWAPDFLPREPVSVDAIPDIGENQQIVFTEWPGRSPQDIDNQVTYPLTTALLGVPGVKTIRSTSMTGFSSIYILFEEDVEYYWSRSRILEKLNALPPGVLPPDAKPALGPDATALGQVFWYTLQHDGGWDLHELRSIQDFQVKYALASAEGVAEVASIGGYVNEYQIDADPEKLLLAGLTITDLYTAVKESNLDVGARTIELNRVEYLVRGIGFIKTLSDLENTVVAVRGDTPIRISDVARVAFGPAQRRGALDVTGAEAVGGVVVSRYGANPLEVIENVKRKLAEIAPGLPERTLADGTVSKVRIEPFYDRSGLIKETIATLETAMLLQILITILVVVVMVMNVRSSLLISGLLPVAVLACFILMKLFGIEANIVALSGIAIAIGTMVDMGVIFTENMIRHMDEAPDGQSRLETIYNAAAEVGSAVLTAVGTTILSFIPVFFLEAAEGKLFSPLAYTKSFALIAAIVVTLLLIPAVAYLIMRRKPTEKSKYGNIPVYASLIGIGWVLSTIWMPLGPETSTIANVIFVALIVFSVLGSFKIFIRYYEGMLAWTLDNKALFLSIPLVILILGGLVWRNLGKEFMPTLDEGSFLLMPTTMPHAGMEEVLEQVSRIDQRVASIPEVETVVGKLGRVESALDPAPISMYENLIIYKSEFGVDSTGERVRQWRDHIRTTDDIWNEIIAAAAVPGVTSAPKLQPIETRLVMLQTGMRAPMGVVVRGPDSKTIQDFAVQVEALLKGAPNVKASAVFADRITGKPYLEVRWNREAMGRYGLSMSEAQMILETAVGGEVVTTTVEGRERYPVRVRYARETRDTPESLERILIPVMGGAQIPLSSVATLEYVQGPMEIRSENTFQIGYVLFDKLDGVPELTAVESARATLDHAIETGYLLVPAGVSYTFAGTFENQIRAEKRLIILIPVVLLSIFLVLYLQFRSTSTSLIIFTGIAVAWAGGFLMLWLYAQPWFLNFSVFGTHMGTLFQVGPVNLSIAVWVGFIALFGIAVDDGVVMATYLDQRFANDTFANKAEVRKAVIDAGIRRIRPCLMTTGTTILALLPVLMSTGKGSDIMVPMAIPAFGGMVFELLTLFVVPVLYSWKKERKYV